MEDLHGKPEKCEECAKRHVIVKIAEDGTVVEVVTVFDYEQARDL